MKNVDFTTISSCHGRVTGCGSTRSRAMQTGGKTLRPAPKTAGVPSGALETPRQGAGEAAHNAGLWLGWMEVKREQEEKSEEAARAAKEKRERRAAAAFS